MAIFDPFKLFPLGVRNLNTEETLHVLGFTYYEMECSPWCSDYLVRDRLLNLPEMQAAKYYMINIHRALHQ